MLLDRLLLLIEILILLWMLKLDRQNHRSIQAFLKSRTEWYARRALQAQMKKAPEFIQVPMEENETVAVLSESEGPAETMNEPPALE